MMMQQQMPEISAEDRKAFQLDCIKKASKMLGYFAVLRLTAFAIDTFGQAN